MTSKWLRPTLGGEQGGREEASGSLQQTGNLLCSRVRPFKNTFFFSSRFAATPGEVNEVCLLQLQRRDIVPGHCCGYHF